MTASQTVAPYEKRYQILAAVMLGSVMGPIDASIVNVVLPTIAESLGTDVSKAQWVPMVYLLTIGSLLMFFGRLGDILGYRKVYLSGLAGFVVTSGLCGLAPSIKWLILFRALQGLSSAMLMSMPFAVITAAFPPQQRGKAMGLNAIGISAGLAIGPSLGGLLAGSFGWPSVFLINIPIGIAGFIWGSRIIPDIKGRPARIDIPGVVLGSLSLVFLILLVNHFRNPGLTSTTGAMLLAAIVFIVAFIKVENKVSEPMLHTALFKSATFTFANISALLNFMSQYIMVFLTPFYLQQVLQLRPNRVGLVMTSFPLAVMAVAPFSGALSDRTGTTKLAFLGAGLCGLSLFLMSRLPQSADPVDVVWRLAIFGLGTGIFQSPNNSAAMGSVPKQHLGIASGILATVRTTGMVLGIATAGTVLAAFAEPSILQKISLAGSDSDRFVTGLRYAYQAGGILTTLAALTSLVKSREETKVLKNKPFNC